MGEDGSNLPHWIEAFDPQGAGAFITIAIPAAATPSVRTMRLYYGDSTRVATSSWGGTFLDVLPAPPIHGISPAEEFEAFPSLERLPDGELIVAYRTGPGHLSREGSIVLARSADAGATWGSTVIFDDPRLDDRVNLGLKRISDGTLLLPGYGYDPPHEQTRAVILQSTDGGWNWSLRSVIASADVSFTETSIAVLKGQKLLAVMRDGEADAMLYRSVSYDAGRTWSEPKPMFDGSSPNLVRLASKRLLLGSSDRTEITGVRLSLSTDDGLSWDRSVLVDPSRETDLGYPSFVQMPDGSILMVHYTRLGGVRQTVLDEEYIAANPNFHNFFDGLEDTETLLDWQIWRLSGWPLLTGPTTTCRSGQQALFLHDAYPNASPYAIRTLYAFGRPEGRLSFWVRADSLVNGVEFVLLSGSEALSAEARFRFRINLEGAVEGRIEDDGVPCARWAPLTGRNAVPIGVWTKIGIHYHADESEAEIRINGIPAGRAGACVPGGGVSYLGFFAGAGSGWGDRILVDDIYAGRCGPEIAAPTVGAGTYFYVVEAGSSRRSGRITVLR